MAYTPLNPLTPTGEDKVDKPRGAAAGNLPVFLPGGNIGDSELSVEALRRAIEQGAVDANYAHYQNFAAPVWTIPHNLGKVPDVTCYEFVGGRYVEVVGSVEFDPAVPNTLVVRFNAPMAGVAICN